jgi:hypothetical protein
MSNILIGTCFHGRWMKCVIAASDKDVKKKNPARSLQPTGGSKKEARRRLRITRKTSLKKLEKYESK